MLRVEPAGSVTGIALEPGVAARVIVGDVVSVTFTPTAGDAIALALSSVAMATSETMPSAAGVQLIVHVPLLAGVVLPMRLPLAKTCTLVIVPSGSVAMPEMVVATVVAKNAPLTGPLMLTVGGRPMRLATLTPTMLEVVESPSLS